MAAERGGLYFMFLGPPSPKFLDPILSSPKIGHVNVPNKNILEKYLDLSVCRALCCGGDRALFVSGSRSSSAARVLPSDPQPPRLSA